LKAAEKGAAAGAVPGVTSPKGVCRPFTSAPELRIAMLTVSVAASYFPPNVHPAVPSPVRCMVVVDTSTSKVPTILPATEFAGTTDAPASLLGSWLRKRVNVRLPSKLKETEFAPLTELVAIAFAAQGLRISKMVGLRSGGVIF
jgi:hypothetical protein